MTQVNAKNTGVYSYNPTQVMMSSSTGNLKYQNGMQNQFVSPQQKYVPSYQNATQYGNYTTGSQHYGNSSYSSYQPNYGHHMHQIYGTYQTSNASK